MKIVSEMWEPLWKNKSSKLVSNDESIAIQRLKDIIRNKNIEIETILDINGNKSLRFKRKYDNKFSINLYDYVLLGPVVFHDRRVYCKQCYTIGTKSSHQDSLDDMSIMLDEDEIAANVKESLFNKKALREAKERRSILERLYDKSS